MIQVCYFKVADNGSGIAEANGFERQKYQYGTELK